MADFTQNISHTVLIHGSDQTTKWGTAVQGTDVWFGPGEFLVVPDKNLAMTINMFGMDQTCKWGEDIWGTAVWGGPCDDLPVDVTKLIANTLTPVIANAIVPDKYLANTVTIDGLSFTVKDFTKVISNFQTVLVDTRLTDFTQSFVQTITVSDIYIQDFKNDNGYCYYLPNNVEKQVYSASANPALSFATLAPSAFTWTTFTASATVSC